MADPSMPSPGQVPPTLAVPTHDWLYYRIHVADTDAADRLLEELVRPLVHDVRADVFGLRWFFLRFLDATGLHVRLRLRAERAALDRIERALDDALDRAMAPARNSSASRTAAALCTSYDKFLYAPEVRKFGAGSGMRLAEELFEAGSEAAVGCLGPRLRTMRVGYGAAHMTVMLDALPERQRPAFLHQYAWYWSGGPLARSGVGHAPPPGFSLASPRAGAQAQRLVEQAGRVLSDPTAHKALRQYRTRFQDAMRHEDRRTTARTDYFVLFHHIHLTNNRLGVFPGTESAIARLMWIAHHQGFDIPFPDDWKRI